VEKRVDTGKTVLVTGGSRGIGRGVAFEFAKAGYDLTIGHWQDEEQATQTADRIRDEWGRHCHVVPGNLADADTAGATVKAALQAMGHIDVLVNNAGITRIHGINELDLEITDQLYMLNFRAPLLLMKEVSRHMIESGIKGSILNITSSRAERAYPGDAVYGGLKAGLMRASQSAALDLAPYGIRVNCIGPGATLLREDLSPEDGFGGRIPLGRMGTPDDIGQIAVWLASAQAYYITGINLRADGGLILPGMPEGSDGWKWKRD
jgi:glucose 1-dehydrogenase